MEEYKTNRDYIWEKLQYTVTRLRTIADTPVEREKLRKQAMEYAIIWEALRS